MSNILVNCRNNYQPFFTTKIFSEGPYATKYNFVLYPDGRRASDVDLGQLGGKTVATARFEGDTLTTYLRKKGKLFMTAKRTIRAGMYINPIC